MFGVIPAAGYGKRMRHLTRKKPKSMITMWSRPFLEHIITQMKLGGIGDIIIVIGYRGEQIRDYFEEGSRFGVSIQYAFQEHLSGQIEALRCALPQVKDSFFILQWSDVLVPAYFYSTLLYSWLDGANVSLAINLHGDIEAGAGVAIDERYRILNIQEKPSASVATTFKWNNSGVMLLPRNIEHFFSAAVERGREEYLTDAIFAFISSGATAIACPLKSEEYIDLKDLASYKRYSPLKAPAFLK